MSDKSTMWKRMFAVAAIVGLLLVATFSPRPAKGAEEVELEVGHWYMLYQPYSREGFNYAELHDFVRIRPRPPTYLNPEGFEEQDDCTKALDIVLRTAGGRGECVEFAGDVSVVAPEPEARKVHHWTGAKTVKEKLLPGWYLVVTPKTWKMVDVLASLGGFAQISEKPLTLVADMVDEASCISMAGTIAKADGSFTMCVRWPGL